MTAEKEVNCPFCGELISIVIDCSVDDQIYTEDCFVCCRPIRFHIWCCDGEVTDIETTRE